MKLPYNCCSDVAHWGSRVGGQRRRDWGGGHGNQIEINVSQQRGSTRAGELNGVWISAGYNAALALWPVVVNLIGFWWWGVAIATPTHTYHPVYYVCVCVCVCRSLRSITLVPELWFLPSRNNPCAGDGARARLSLSLCLFWLCNAITSLFCRIFSPLSLSLSLLPSPSLPYRAKVS